MEHPLFSRRYFSTFASLGLTFVIILIGCMVSGQENAQTRIPNSLIECYENPEIYERDYRLPATIGTLIELIRKVEDSREYYSDIQQTTVGLLHRFRLDGIEKAAGVYQRNVLPFSPSGYQFSKHRLLLTRLIQGGAQNFPNNTLSRVERCALHFLISNSIETQVRGDEATRCGQLAQFRSMRLPHPFDLHRKKRHYLPEGNNFLCDIEVMEDSPDRDMCLRRKKSSDRYMRARYRTTTKRPTEYDYEHENENPGDYPTDDDYIDETNPHTLGRDGLVDVASNAISQCPVENGVVRTIGGSVSVGPLLAGIAAGLKQQNVATRELLLLTRNHMQRGRHTSRQQVQLNIDNRWAATLAGDLAEVALLQGPGAREVRVGAAGAWNSTTTPHWYFLSQRERLEMTDAEIRGGIDGLVIGLNVAQWRGQASQLKLSQLLDMYYSQRGIFSQAMRSCNRRELFTKFVQPEQLQTQTVAFSTVLDREMQLRVTLTNQGIASFSNAAADALVSYVSNGLNDVSCDASSTLTSSTIERAKADLYIFIDATWQFAELQSSIAVLLDNLDVNQYGTRYTLLNANKATVIVNTTDSLSDLYTKWNQTTHQMETPGLNLNEIIKQLNVIGKNLLSEEHTNSSLSGRSFIALIVPQMAGVNEADANYAAEQIFYQRESQPDLTLLFWSGGSVGRFTRFVRDSQRDLFQLMAYSTIGGDSGQQILTNALPVIQRIRSIPRRIKNPRCNSDWQQVDWGTSAMDDYVEPGGVNFYRIHPNNFFKSGGVVRIQSRSQSQIVVCESRWKETPRFSNSSQQQENVYCKQLLATQSHDINLHDACSGHYLIQSCPPLYISVEGVSTSAQGQGSYMCSDPACRFPDSIKFGISIENLGCYSGVAKIAAQFLTIIVALSFAINTLF